MQNSTEAIKPIRVEGYVRNKKAIEAQAARKAKAEQTDIVLPAIMFGGTFVIVAVIFWQFTLTVAALIAAGWYAKKRIKQYYAEPRLVIHRFR